MTDFELLTQSWVLRVGHHALVTEHSAFLAVTNGIVDWKTVHCDGGNLLYDTSSLTSDLVGLVECDILDNAYPTVPDCTNASCSVADAVKCSVTETSPSACSVARAFMISDFCGTIGCSLPSECCIVDNLSACCNS